MSPGCGVTSGKKKIYREGGGGEEQNENSGITLPLSSSSPLPSLLYATRHRFFSFFFSRINRRIEDSCRMSRFSLRWRITCLFIFVFFFFTTKHACFSFARLEKLFVLSIRKLIAIFFFLFSLSLWISLARCVISFSRCKRVRSFHLADNKS